jgi:hypothetical protein
MRAMVSGYGDGSSLPKISILGAAAHLGVVGCRAFLAFLFNHVTDEQLDRVIDELNNRPRPCRSHRTPSQLMARWKRQLIAS